MTSFKPLTLNTPGQKHGDFILTRVVEIPEVHCVLRELIHVPTNAQVMHIGNDDSENVFCLSFQTCPDTSNGVAHILEHTVLCGSKKYPVKDPFFAMTRRSLNTYMNALTGPDFTCYPAASQVPKDFYNLLDVYLDAVFHPNLDQLNFLQEGHRLEFAIPSDPSTPLEYKGVVFNEMKGALASGSARATELLSEALFPDLTYGINSGGDPQVIPQLSYEELKEFHRKYYHPSRCLFYFYGNIPLEQHLDFIAQHALKDVEKASPLHLLPLQKRFSAPKRLERSYPVSPEEDLQDKDMISFGWLTGNMLDQQEVLALCIIDIILMETDASTLKLALMKSGLCKQVGAYINIEIPDVPLVITVRGCKAEDASKIEELIKTTLRETVKKGIPLEAVEDAIHQLEIYRSEITGGHTPFGLSLFMRAGLLKQHGVPPEAGLKIHSLFEEVRKKNLEDPHYLTGLIQRYLIDNPHFVRLVMVGDKTLAARESASEREKLDEIRSQLTPNKEKELIETASKLAAFQVKQEEANFDLLPKVTLSDVSKVTKEYALHKEPVGALDVYHHATFTNEIIYADLTAPLPAIEERDLPFVKILTSLIPQLGCGGRTYAENLEYEHAHTGGVNLSLGFDRHADDLNLYTPTLAIKGKALHRKAEKLLRLMGEMRTSVNIDDIPRIKEVILKQYTVMQSNLNQAALRYATTLSSSPQSAPAKILNMWNGIDYFFTMRDLALNFDAKADQLVAKLKELQGRVLSSGKLDLILTCDTEIYNTMKSHGFYGLQNLEVTPSGTWKDDFVLKPVEPQGRVITSPVAFITKAFKTVPYNHRDTPAICVFSSLVDNIYLHTLLREQGGAYGGGASFNAMTGNFYFYSYRDPNISRTFKAFDDALAGILEGKFTEKDLEEAKLEIIQSLDKPIAPGSRGEKAYGWLKEGRTNEMRQQFRDRLLDLKPSDIIEAVRNQILPNMQQAPEVVFAGRELLEKENVALKAMGRQPLRVLPI